MMDNRVIRPATDAKEYLQPLRKVIKKRENKRLDWEHYIDKVNTAQRKLKRTDRENAALAKTEEELAKAADVSNLSLCLIQGPSAFVTHYRVHSASVPDDDSFRKGRQITIY